jgi:LPS sulfotransferase NodH
MAWDEQFDAALDFPPDTQASLKYAICSTPRCGSHFLSQLLFATGRFGCPLEYFQPGNLIRWQERARQAGAEDLTQFLLSIRTSPNGCFGLKAHFTQLDALGRYIPLADFLTGFRHIHIVRRDLLAQAISFERAQQTDNWISRAPDSGRTAVYDAARIRRRLVEIARQNASWDYLFNAFGVRRLVVEYELLAADPEGTVRRLADFIGVDLPAGAAVAKTRTAAQRDETSEAWRELFLQDMRRDSSWASLEVLQRTPPAAAPAAAPRWREWLKI